MRSLWVAMFLLSGTAVASTMNWTQVDQAADDEMTFFVEEVATPSDVERRLGELFGGQPRDNELVLVEKIINLAQKVWTIIEKNQPVVNIRYNYANALPKGVRGPEDLDSFSALQSRSFRLYGKNGFGATPYDVTFTLLHRYGGSYDGRGSYLDAVTVLPHRVDALWGYTINFGVDRVSTTNVGSKERPVASLLMEMSFKVHTVIKKSEYRGVYEFRGDSPTVGTINSLPQEG